MKKRIISLALVLLMVLSLIPTALAVEEDVVYLSVYNDGSFVTTSSGTVMAYVAVPMSELEKIDLAEYGMGDYLYDADDDGAYDVTALHLFIYAHEKLYGGNWSDVYCSGMSGSLYFGGGLFGFTENMTYYHNGGYPLDAKLTEVWGNTMDVGATADHIALEPGDYVDLSGYSDWGFYSDPSAGFRYFLNSDGNVTHSYTCGKGEALTVSLATATQTWEDYSWLIMSMVPEVSNTVCYSQTLLDPNAKTATTDENGKAVITPDAYGTWYVWSLGDGVSSPAYAEVTVAWKNTNNVTSDWANFRNSDVNMALTSAKTPTSAETTVLKWAKKLGSGWSANPSVQIIVDNSLIVMSGTTLYKLDLQSGEILQQATMTTSPNFGYTPCTYANGLIFCPLSGGIIQAFDAKTLESVWIYTDALGGQSLSPITYADGCVYTGFWNGENKDANYVCVDVSDGSLVWNKTVLGGFYWAGSVVLGDTLIVGTDDGASGYTGDSHLYSMNKDDGTVISNLTLTGCGDQRSSMAYSEAKGRVYFTAKNGYLCSAKVDTITGELSDLKTSKQANQCTSTPVVYGDQVYFSCGSGVVVGSGGNGNFIVADADTLEQHYAVALKAYPQGSVLVSDAYLKETGKLYCYSTYNGQPGGLSLITVDPTVNTADGAELIEIYDAKGYEQYCITSPICGTDGTIYYKNDSGAVFAVGTNNAYLTALNADVGTLNGEFAASNADIEWIVPVGTTSVTLNPNPCQGGSAQSVTVALEDGVATAEITVLKDGDSRTYTVSIREVSIDTSLSELKVNESNSYTGKALALSPEFVKDTYYYAMLAAGSSRSFENVWPTATDANANVKVYAISNVDECDTGDEIAVTATNQSHDRYAVYFADDTKAMAIRIEVTAENGDVANYYLVLSKEAAAADGEALLETLKNCTHENATVSGAKDATCTEDGYTGDKTCPDCGAVISGTVIDALGHDYKDGICTVCGEADPDYKTAEGEVHVFVTIADKGNVVLFQQSITVIDVNHNGIFDVDDALYAAHEASYEGGAAAGYSSYESQWGLSIGMLWGDTSYCYGYWLNNASCWSLEDVVAEGNHLVAFVYSDSDFWSDSYAEFEQFDYAATAGEALTVKLDKAGYDENWNTVFSAHAGATVTVYDNEGKALTEGYTVTDNGDGTYTVTVDAEGSYYVVATDSDPLLVPAVCELTVSKKAEDVTDPTTPADPDTPQTGDSTNIALMVSILVISLCSMAALVVIRKKKFF